MATESVQWSVVFKRRPSSSHFFRAVHSFRRTSNGSGPMVALEAKWRRSLYWVDDVQPFDKNDSTMCCDDAMKVVAPDRERGDRIIGCRAVIMVVAVDDKYNVMRTIVVIVDVFIL